MDLHDELACVLFMRVKCMLSLARDEFMLIVSSVEVRLSVLTRVAFSNETPQQVGQRELLSGRKMATCLCLNGTSSVVNATL